MVDKRKLDKLGIEASLLGFGVMRLPISNGNDADINVPEAEKMFDLAIANGVNYFDTAVFYHSGNSEKVMGELLKKYPRESLYYATKLPVGHVKEEGDVFKVFESQLENLQTDYIDFYLLHGIGENEIEPIKKFKILEKLEQLKAEGKIKYIGFSFHGSLESFKKTIEIYDWEFCMIQLSYIDTENQQGIEGYNILAEKNIPAMIMEPIRGGNLASFNDEIGKVFKPFNANGESYTSFALRWLANFPNVKVILSGMSTLEQVAENAKILENPKPMSDAEIEMLARVKEMLETTKSIGCTACRYCMPCPENVNIVDSFAHYNNSRFHNVHGGLKWFMGEARNSKTNPELCTHCGACSAKCPQALDIPKLLNDVVELYEEVK